MENNINLFNAIATLKVLAADNDAIKAVLATLEAEVNSLKVQYSCTTGVDILQQQKAAREAILDEIYPTREGEKKIELPCDVVDKWFPWIVGPINDGNIDVCDDRHFADFGHRAVTYTIHLRVVSGTYYMHIL